MGDNMSGILTKIAIKLLTQKFIVKTTLIFADFLASKTDNKLDDKLVDALKEALQ